jgi:hypothetical protein
VTEQRHAVVDRAPIFVLFGANAISQVGNMMIMVAGPWFVLETTGSVARVGLTAAAVGVGAVLPAARRYARCGYRAPHLLRWR